LEPEAAASKGESSAARHGAAREAASKTLVVMTSRALAMIVSLVGLYFYTRTMQKSEWATGLIVAFLGESYFCMSDLGLGLCLERRLPGILVKDRHEGLTLIGVFVVVMMVAAVLLALLLFLVREPLAEVLLKDREQGTVIAWGIPFAVSILWRNGLFCVMRGTNCYGRLSVLSLVTQVLFVAATVCGYKLLGVKGFVLGASAAYVVPCAYESWKLRRYFGVVPTLASMVRYIRYSLSMFGERVVNFAYTFADQWIIGLILTPAALATYNVPRSFFDRFQSFIDGLWMVPTTLISREAARSQDAVLAALRRLRRLFTYVFVPLGIGLLASSYFIVDVLAGEKYRDATQPFAVLALHYLVLGLAAANAIIGISTVAEPRARLKTIISKNIVYVALLPVLAHMLSLNGVAGARLLATITEACVAAVLMRRILKVKWEWDALRAVATPALLMFAIIAGGQYFFYSRALAPVLLVLGAAVYLVLFFRFVAEEDLVFIENILPDRLQPLLAWGRRCRPAAAA